TRPSTAASTGLTIRQRKFIAGRVEGKSQHQAAIDAGVPPGGADSFARRALKKEQIQNAFQELLDRAGLSEETIAQVHAENLKATKVVAVRWRDGDPDPDVVERPDYPTRQRAVNDAWRLHGRADKSTSQERPRAPIILPPPPEDLLRVEGLRGSPLPPHCYVLKDVTPVPETPPPQVAGALTVSSEDAAAVPAAPAPASGSGASSEPEWPTQR